MSKNTKIVAIVGGVLILFIVVYTLVWGGGPGQALEAVGCGGKKEGKPPRHNLVESAELGECLNYGHACVRDEKGVTQMVAGKKECQKKPAGYCKTLWGNKCKDEAFKKANAKGCEKLAAAGEASDADDDKDDDKDEKPREAEKPRADEKDADNDD